MSKPVSHKWRLLNGVFFFLSNASSSENPTIKFAEDNRNNNHYQKVPMPRSPAVPPTASPPRLDLSRRSGEAARPYPCSLPRAPLWESKRPLCGESLVFCKVGCFVAPLALPARRSARTARSAPVCAPQHTATIARLPRARLGKRLGKASERKSTGHNHWIVRPLPVLDRQIKQRGASRAVNKRARSCFPLHR